MFKTVVTLSILGTILWAQTGTPAQVANPVLEWNRNLLAIVRTPGAQPQTIHATRSFAIMHVAIYDAVNAIDRTHRSYMEHHLKTTGKESIDAAAAAAAYQVLARLYPSFRAMLNAELERSLENVPPGFERIEGIRIGREVADHILAARINDGSNVKPIPYVFKNGPGHYESTPPNFPPQPQFTHWSRVTPFALRQASQFRPAPPPELDSDRYVGALNSVERLGNATGSTADADQALTGHFWNGAIQNYWNEIAQTAALAHHLNTTETARVFALLNLSLADSVIAFYDAKYTYNFWRPVTAIREADASVTPNAIANPNWLPEVGKTPPDPSYPGAHAVLSAAAAEVLATFFEGGWFDFDVTSEVMPGVKRHFTSLFAASEEAKFSRVFAGVHFLFDLTSGETMGRDVADFVLDHTLTALDQDKDVDTTQPE